MGKDKEGQKSSAESWIGKFPFPPDKKRPCLVRPSDAHHTIYGQGKERISPRIYMSTDKILMSDWSVPPGQSFYPPDIHAGDEPYYVLKGTATVVNHETGQAIEAHEGDVVLVPAKCWHAVYNFTDDDVVIAAIIAGKVWEKGDEALVSEYKQKPRFLKAD
jgi:mannose-6-phosphate isomerase-like protein (cupin superfamily)